MRDDLSCSGVGTAGIQLAKLFGAQVATTVGSEEKVAYCETLGASKAVNYKKGSWSVIYFSLPKSFPPFLFSLDQGPEHARIHEILEERRYDAVLTETQGLKAQSLLGFDIVYECIGKDYVEANQEVLGTDSRWIIYSYQSGPEADKLSFNVLMRKRITLSGTVLRARSADYKTKLVQQFQDEAIHGFLDGTLRVVTDKVWPMEQIAEAHKYMEDNLTKGKLVITVIAEK